MEGWRREGGRERVKSVEVRVGGRLRGEGKTGEEFVIARMVQGLEGIDQLGKDGNRR